MSLESEVLPILRNLINDTVEASYEYSDERLLGLIYMAAYYVNVEIIAGHTISVCNQTMTPQPSEQFITLTAYKAACMLSKSLQMTYAQCDFRVTDGPATVDLKNAADKIDKSAQDFCDTYNRLKINFAMTEGGLSLTTPNSES